MLLTNNSNPTPTSRISSILADSDWLDRTCAVVLAVVSLMLIVSLRLDLGFNTPYADESDYMFVGQQLLAGYAWPAKSYIFSSDLPLYFIGAGANLGGITGARMLSLLPGLGSLLVLYVLYSGLLRNRLQAFYAVAIVATHATHIFQSKFATYDIWCLFWFALSIALLDRHNRADRPVSLSLICASIAFVLAVLCKYVVVAYIPLIAIFIWLHGSRGTAMLFVFIQTLALGIYATIYSAELQTLIEYQLLGQHLLNSNWTELLTVMAQFCWPVLLLGIIGAVYLNSPRTPFQNRPSLNRKTYYGLLLLATLLPAYHLLTGNRIALYKHMVYPVMFLAPIAALGVAQLQRLATSRLQWSVPAGVALLLSILAYQQVTLMESSYPNTTRAVEVLREQSNHHSTILSENPYLHRFEFNGEIPLQNLHDLDALPTATNTDFDSPLMREIIKGRYQLIYLDGRFHPQKTEFLRTTLPTLYDEIYSQDYATSGIVSGNTHGRISIYKLLE